MKQPWLQVYRALIVAILILAACHPSPRDLTLVSGKTVYGNLALEDVHLEIHRWEESGWDYHGETRSGYHGSFRIHLPPGTYSFTASKTIRIGREEVPLTGTLIDLEIAEPGGRVDQVIIRMEQK